MRVSLLEVSDASRYRGLMLEAYQLAEDAFTSTAEERAVEPESFWEKRICEPRGLSVVFGAFIGAELVGAVALEFSAKPKTQHKAHLVGMYVAPQGRGQGAGRALVHAALAFIEGRPDIAIVTLTVTEGNAPAINLYQSAGFQPFGTEPMAVRTAKGFKAKVHMWRAAQQAE